jgi:protein CpxP
MKKLLFICALVFGVATFASAQGQGGGQRGGTPEERIKRQTDQLVEKLKLTDEQKTKATAIFTAQVAAQTKMREEAMAGGGDRAAMMEKMQKANAEVQAKITEILTDDQKKAYKAMLDEQKAEMEKRRAAAGGGNGK